MTDKDFVLSTLKQTGQQIAQALQMDAPDMTGTEIIAQEDFLPDFNPERQYLNFKAGYICKSDIGNAVKLLQPYDSTIYTQQPEELPAQWGFYWSTDPAKAKPFMSLSTSPYNKGDCCTFNDSVYQSKIDTNTWSPNDYAQGWNRLGPISEYIK